MDVSALLRQRVLPEHLGELGLVLLWLHGTTEVDEIGKRACRRWCLLLFDNGKVETLLVENVDGLLRHLHEREQNSLLLAQSSLELVLFQLRPQLFSEEPLAHKPGHAGLDLDELDVFKVTSVDGGRVAIFLQDCDFIKLD